MGRILALDYGAKRTGIAVTDPLRIIATPLETVPSDQIFTYLRQYLERETVDEFVVGMPRTLANLDSSFAPEVRRFVAQLKEVFPTKPVAEVDERFTSQIASRTLREGGMKKKARRDKSHVDRISATLILQTYLESRQGA